MERYSKKGGLQAPNEGGATKKPTGNTLENFHRGNASEAVKDKSIGDIECANDETGPGDNLP
jgi:hypothetical protein